MFCPNCGKEIDGKFCGNCGYAVPENDSASTQSATNNIAPQVIATQPQPTEQNFDSKKNMLCKSCGKAIAKNAKACPYCGAKNKKPIFKRVWFWILIVIVFLFGFLLFSGSDTTTTKTTQQTTNRTPVTNNTTEATQAQTEAKLDVESLKAACKSYTFTEIARNPNVYKGEYAVFDGSVEQVVQDETDSSYGVYRICVTNDDDWWTDAILVVYEGSFEDGSRLIEDDEVKMYGILDGTYTYETVMGDTMTVPMFRAYYMERMN